MSRQIANPFEEIVFRLSILEELIIDVKDGLKDIGATNNNQDRFLNKGEVAKIWGCSERTVDRMVERETLKRYYLGSAIRFKLSEVMEALES